MYPRYTMIALAALLSAGWAMGQPPSNPGNGTSIDKTALAAKVFWVHVKFGTGSLLGTDCVGSTSTGYCFATANFFVPKGKRMVIENISGSVTFQTGTTEVMMEALGLMTVVGNEQLSYILPFDRSQIEGTHIHYYLNKSVRIYADSGITVPQISLANLTGLGPVFTTPGYMSFTFSGYLVDL